MNKKLLLVCILCAGFVLAEGQTPGSTPTPAQATQKVISPRRDESLYDTERRINPQRDPTQSARITFRNPAFRKPTKEDLQLVAPDAEDAAKYADFLRQSKTGLIRLLSDEACQENAIVVVANDFCMKYKNVFGGSSYSFRARNYAVGRFSDVVYKNGTLYSTGKMTLGFLVDLGTDVSLKDVSAETAGAKYVFEFVPPEDLPQIEATVAIFLNGVETNSFKYQKFYSLQENHTYLLRSVAYRKRGQSERNILIYDELANDERKDVIIALQVVRLSDVEKNSVTLLWKELQRKDAAKITVDKK